MRTTALLIILLCAAAVYADVTIGTWNIEHLGSPGRGFGGGYGAGALPMRSEEDLQNIAALIHTSGIDLLCIQEVAVTDSQNGRMVSAPLDFIRDQLGSEWAYHVAPRRVSRGDPSSANMQSAFLWNSGHVTALAIEHFPLPNVEVGSADTFDRYPLVGYFESVRDGGGGNDFVVVNVHLASGQDNDETHLVAMVMIEQNLSSFLRSQGIRESDRIIIGDFNNNPYKTDIDGNPEYSNALYDYMAEKGFIDLIAAEIGYTRLNDNLDSIIDHVLVNSSIRRHMDGLSLTRILPADSTESSLSVWRRMYSDHLPLLFRIVAGEDDDSDTP